MKWYVGFLLVGLLLAGACRTPKLEKGGEVSPDRGQLPQSMVELETLYSQVDTLMRAGDTNAAIHVLNEAFEKSKANAQNRALLFNSLLQTLLMADKVEDARKKYLAVIGRDEELTRTGFNQVYQYYQRKGDHDALIVWTKHLMDAPLPNDLSEQAFVWRLEATRAKGPFDQVLQLVPVCIKKYDNATSVRILDGLIHSVVEQKQYDEAKRLLDLIEKKSRTSPALQALAAIERINLLCAQNQWPEAEQQFMKIAPGLSDDELSHCLNQVVSRAVQEKKFDLGDRVCEFVVKQPKGKDKPGAGQKAATQWVDNARQRKTVTDVVNRLEVLQQVGFSPTTLLTLCDNHFDFILQNKTPDVLRRMVNLNDRLIPTLDNERDKGAAKLMMLDEIFLLEDYARVLKMLEDRIPGRDEKWHKSAINKIQSHLALKEGKKQEAVEWLRKFMDTVSESGEDVIDPMTGMLYTKDMCLGDNAKRIGDILASMGDEPASRKAYEEAKRYYKKALAEQKADSKEYLYIQAELAKIKIETPPPISQP